VSLFARVAPAAGVHELRRRDRGRILSIDDFEEAAPEQNALLEARTEILLHKLYDVVARSIARGFTHLAEPDGDERLALEHLAELVGRTLIDEDGEPTAEEVDEVVWRNAARACTLTLFDHLANSVATLAEEPGAEAFATLGAKEWVRRVLNDPLFNDKTFRRISGLVGDEVEWGLQVAAEAITEWEYFRTPGKELRYNSNALFVIANAEAHELQCVLTDTPTLAFLATDNFLFEDDDTYVFAANDSTVMPVTDSLYLQDFASHITVTSGDFDQITPKEFGVSLILQNAKPTITQGHGRSTVLTFDALTDDAVVTILKAGVRRLPGHGFLLESNLED
jgi:hypothetical protein